MNLRVEFTGEKIIIHTENKENGKNLFNNVIDIVDNKYYNVK